MKHSAILCIGVFTIGCSAGPENSAPSVLVSVPTEIIDLGATITEQTPEDFWGKAFLSERGFTKSNRFDVIEKTSGPVSVSNSYFTLFNHGGPHVDAPNHVGLGEGLDAYPVEAFTGPLKAFDFSYLPIGRSITKEMLVDLPIDSGDIVLIYTGYSPSDPGSAWPQAIALNYEAATYLATLPIRAFGTDAWNVESMTDQSPVQSDIEVARIIPGHYAFLSRGIPVFEQLVNVNKLLGNQSMFFVGAPLNIKDADGMMVRPIVLVY